MRLSRHLTLVFACAALAAAAATAPAPPGPPPTPWQAKVDPWVSASAASGPTEFLVFLGEQADLGAAARLRTKAAKGRFVSERLRETAERTQGPLLARLLARGAEHQSFWVANMVWVKGDLGLVEELARRADVAHVYANPSVRFSGPVAQGPTDFRAPQAVEPGVAKVRAPEVWAAGFTGQTVVVGGQDTGYEWTHPAIQGKYRGWNGATADHNYNWHDSIHSGGGSCGANSPEPCDDNNHGTHTMGTMVGDDGAGNQIGVAPGARWIGCRNMDQGNGTPATYSECFQWFIAPTDLGNQNPDPTKAPHVINNSWSCPPSEGCTDPNVLKTVVDNTRAAGILVVVSATNAGPGCSSVADPAAIYQSSFSVGATSITDVIASFSSRGPVTSDGSNRLKPNVSAPGVNVRSSVRGGGYATFNGTSMAGPHVVGTAALLFSARPSLEGQVGTVETRIQTTAFPLTTTQSCGSVPGSQVPNNTYGWGRVDAYLAMCVPDAPVITAPLDAPPMTAGLQASVPSQSGHTYAWTLTGGTITAGQGTSQITFTAGSAGTTMALSVVDTAPACGSGSPPGRRNVQVDFLDVPVGHPFHGQVNTLARNQVTGGCGGGNYCPAAAVTREQMAVFLLVAKEGPGYTPPACTTPVFNDVPCSSPFAPWISELQSRGITSGCGGGSYCPAAAVTREQMAVFLLLAKEGSGYTPPACTTAVFNDVPCTSPFAPWINELNSRGITGGCGGGSYCPASPNTRGEMAVFLVTTFGLS
jgi:subtilisin family serine protease